MFLFTFNFNSLLLQLQFFLFSLLNKNFFSRKYAIFVNYTSTTFFALVSHSHQSSSLRCLFCVLLKLSRALFLISTAFAVSTFFLSFSTVSSAATFFRLSLPEPFPPRSNHIRLHLPSLRLSSLL